MKQYHRFIFLLLGCWLSLNAVASDSISIVFTGDILLDRGVRRKIESVGFHRLISPSIAKLFKQSDVVVGNLECPATKIKEPVFKRFIFRSEPELLDSLKAIGITHLNLANNHSIDQGRRGLMDTRRNIEKTGMIALGADSTMEKAIQPTLLANKMRNVWLFASLRLPLENTAYLPEKPSVSQQPIDSLITQVKQLRKKDKNAYNIVSLHWGWEHHLQPLPQQRIDAHRLIDAGADILICHHPHTLQTIEEYKGHRIYYSIGNFIFDQQKPINTRACVVKLVITKNKANVTTLPIEIERCTPIIKF